MAIDINIPIEDAVTDGSLNPVTSNAVFDGLALKANSADLATVATSGDYNDLSNLPTIPAAQVNADWNATSGVAEILNKPTIPSVTNFVPYTGATNDVDLGVHDLTATQGTFATSGNPDTLTVNHSSGSGKALTITKGGNGEGVYVNKTSGSGNAVTVIGDLEATNLKRTGGTSAQFLKANGSIDSTSYQPTLVSGTNIKTINGNSLLGSGDLVVGGSSGVCGIPNSSGVYTFYATLSLAITAASSGQTIEVFTSITETGNVQLNLKNGVNINFNGHTYTLNSAGTANAISDNGASVTVKLMNGTINRTGGTNTGSNSFSLDVINTSSNIDATDMKFTSSFSLACRLFDGTLTGGFYSGFTTGISITSGIANNIYSYGQTSDGIGMNGGELSNSKVLSNGRYGILHNAGIISNCFIKSTANSGCLTQGGIINSSTFFSTSSSGLWIYSGTPVVNQCLGYSTASVGIQLETTGRVSNCNGYSTVNRGINVSINTPIYNCVSESLSNVGLTSQGGVYGCTAKSYWNNASGHAMSGTNPDVFNCNLEVTNASANCLHHTSAINVKFGANVFKGATTQVNANITQSQTILPDLYGNIKIG
jgi:hypothetical protein